MPSDNCAVMNDKEPETCPHGCFDITCCKATLGGENAHHCLSQLLKRLGREPHDSDSCGGCKTKLKEKSDSSRGLAPG